MKWDVIEKNIKKNVNYITKVPNILKNILLIQKNYLITTCQLFLPQSTFLCLSV